eukprot:6194702-Pleurochrysis_carterae.AAC.1
MTFLRDVSRDVRLLRSFTISIECKITTEQWRKDRRTSYCEKEKKQEEAPNYAGNEVPAMGDAAAALSTLETLPFDLDSFM